MTFTHGFHKMCKERTTNWHKITQFIYREYGHKHRDQTSEAVSVQIRNGLINTHLATLFIQNDGDKIFKVKPVKGHISGIVMPFPMLDVNFTVGWHLSRFTITPNQELFETDWLNVGYRLERERNYTFKSYSTKELNDQYDRYEEEGLGKEFIANEIAQSIADRSFELYYEYKWLYLMARYVTGYSGGALKLLDEMNIEPKRNYRYPKSKVFALIDKCEDKFSKIKPIRITL